MQIPSQFRRSLTPKTWRFLDDTYFIRHSNSERFKDFMKNNNNCSCHTVPIDNMFSKLVSNIECPEVISTVENFQCNSVNIEICEDDQLYPPLTLDLYSIPAPAVSVTCVN